MSLSAKRIFVAGATGEVGSGAVKALVNAGATVFIGGRNESKLQDLKASVSQPDNVVVVAADYSTVDGAKELEEKITKLVDFDKFDSVIASSGPWWPYNELSKVPDLDIFQKAVNSNLEAHVYLYRILAPRTKEHFITINGAAALGLPKMGLTGILAYAVMGFSKVAYYECSKSNALPSYTHCLLASSVGHEQQRQNTHNAEEYGRAFVAMTMGLHSVDETGTIHLDDAMYESLVQKL